MHLEHSIYFLATIVPDWSNEKKYSTLPIKICRESREQRKMRKFQHTFAARRLVNPLCYSLRFDRMMKLPNGHKIKSKIGLRFFRASDLSITLTNNKKPHPEKENLEFGIFIFVRLSFSLKTIKRLEINILFI